MISAPVLCLTDLADSLQVIVPLLYMPAFPLTFILLRSRVRPETLNKVREMHTSRAHPRRSAVAGCAITPRRPPKVLASMIAIAASHAAWIQFGAALLLG